MKAESTVRPAPVERYTGLTRINYDVREETRDNGDGESTFFVYHSVELRSMDLGLDGLVSLLIDDKYPLEEQVRILSKGDDVSIQELASFKFGCKRMAMQVLGIPETEQMKDEYRALQVERINASVREKILKGFVWNIMHGEDAGKKATVWLSSENQANYKSLYDVSRQTPERINYPFQYKVGESEDGVALYEEFRTPEELTEFYFGGMAHIQNCLHEGWHEKSQL